MTGRTLVVHSGGVGDFICALPALQVLGESNAIEIAGIPERAALAVESGVAIAAHDLDRTEFHTIFSTPSDRFRALASGFNTARVFMKDDDHVIRDGLRDIGIPDVRCFPGIPPQPWDRRAPHWYADCLEVSIRLPFELPVRPATGDYDVVIHPGSGDPKKNWPPENFEALAIHLEARGRNVCWCVGPAEQDYAHVRNMLPSMPLTQLATVLRSCKLFIGNDSGIGHLAAVTGCPTISIFGPTCARIWSPVGPRTQVLTGSPWPSVEQVLETAVAYPVPNHFPSSK